MPPVLDNRSLIDRISDNISDQGRAYHPAVAVAVAVPAEYFRAAVRTVTVGREFIDHFYHFCFPFIDLDTLIGELKGYGLDGIEVLYPKHTSEMQDNAVYSHIVHDNACNLKILFWE